MESNHIYQYSLVNALMAGVCETGISVQQLIAQGNQGIGTFVRMSGELLMLDGKVYQLLAEGKIREADETDEIPYAVSTHFVPQETIQTRLETKNSIDDILESFNDHAGNLFMIYRVEGRFETLKARTVKGQEYEGQPLAELGKKQYVETYKDIQGTIVGFRAPEAWQGFFVAGEHMHFINEDRTIGGHVLELSGGDVTIGVATANNVHIELPTSRAFNDAKFKVDDSGIKAVEG